MTHLIPEGAKQVARKAGGVSPLLQLRFGREEAAVMQRRAERAAEARIQAQRRAELRSHVMAEQREAQNRGIDVIDDETDTDDE